MRTKAFKSIMRAFPLVVFALFASIVAINDQYKILGMFILLIMLGLSLRIFKFKKIIINAVFKLCFLTFVYYILRPFFLTDVYETVVFIIAGMTIMFFGTRAYEYAVKKNVLTASLTSMVFCIIIFHIYRNAAYAKNLLDILVPLVISINIFCLYFINNDDEILHMSRHEHKSKTKILKANRKMIIIIMLLAGIASFFREIVDFIEKGLLALIKAAGWLIVMFLELLGSSLSQTEDGEGGGGGGGFDFLPEDDKGPSIIWTILEYFLYVVIAVIVLIALFFLSKKIYALLKKFISYLLSVASKERSRSSAEYVDIVETENIMNVTGRAFKNAFNRIIAQNADKFRAKTKREEIRYQYKVKIRKLKKRGFDYKPAYTPEDVCELQDKSVNIKDKIIRSEFVDLYNMARYSDIEIEKNTKQ